MCHTTSFYFFSNLDFDWMLVRRKHSLTWPGLVCAAVDIMHRCMNHTDVPVQVYLANRLASIACVVSTMVGLNVSSQINCQVCWSVDDIRQLVENALPSLLGLDLNDLCKFSTSIFNPPLENSDISPMSAFPSPRIGALPPPHRCPRVSFAPELHPFPEVNLFGKRCNMEVFQHHHRSQHHSDFDPLGCLPPLFVDQSSVPQCSTEMRRSLPHSINWSTCAIPILSSQTT